MATFVMQSMGCEVAALNTVHFSEIYPRPIFGLKGDQDRATELETMLL